MFSCNTLSYFSINYNCNIFFTIGPSTKGFYDIGIAQSIKITHQCHCVSV